MPTALSSRDGERIGRLFALTYFTFFNASTKTTGLIKDNLPTQGHFLHEYERLVFFSNGKINEFSSLVMMNSISLVCQ